MSNPETTVYELHETHWHAVVTITDDQAEVGWRERSDPEEVKPYVENAVLEDEDRATLDDVLVQVRQSPRPKPVPDEPIYAVLSENNIDFKWTRAQLADSQVSQRLRVWMESHVHLSYIAGAVAMARAEQASEQESLDTAARWWRQAVDRLEDWWKPEPPFIDETGGRHVLALDALEHGQHAEAIRGFSRVFELRAENYELKYEVEDPKP